MRSEFERTPNCGFFWEESLRRHGGVPSSGTRAFSFMQGDTRLLGETVKIFSFDTGRARSLRDVRPVALEEVLHIGTLEPRHDGFLCSMIVDLRADRGQRFR